MLWKKSVNRFEEIIELKNRVKTNKVQMREVVPDGITSFY